jgi:hypothetical protein
MRVTKIIREYVEKTVTNALPFGAPREEYIAADRKLNDLCNQLEEQVDTYAKELLANIGNLPEGFTIKRTNTSIFSASSWNSPMHCASNTHQRKIRDKRAAAVERILVELELGATKADLERLIAEAINE